MQMLIDTKGAAKKLRHHLASHQWPTYTFDELGVEAIRILKLPDQVKGKAIQKAVENFSRSHPEEDVKHVVDYLSEFFVRTVFSLSDFIPLQYRSGVEFHNYTEDDELIIVSTEVDSMS